ncbi:hypothetical protein EAF00_010172 [Botryotinia globosa]|nr:hypothetical protein EAF00_010172 [Botryotinia globosa]
MHPPVNNSLRGHPTWTSLRPRLVRRNAEENVALTLQTQRAHYDAMMAERDIEYPTMALRSSSNTDDPQVTGDAQTLEVIHAVEVTNAPQTAEAGLNSLTGNILATTTSSTSTISSVVVVNAQVFSAPDSPSSSLGGSPVGMRENSHDQENDHANTGQVTSSSSDVDMHTFIAAILFSIISAVFAPVEENDSTVLTSLNFDNRVSNVEDTEHPAR